MIPAFCGEDAPPGEKALFARLATGEATDGWIVLHSLGIASHVRQVEGEADFVVIVPDHGVLVIEVKSHRSVQVLPDGRWQLGTDAPTVRGPIKQADEAMQSIRQYLQQKGADLSTVPMGYAAWFTGTRARANLPGSVEWQDWQILDSADMDRDVPGAILRTLEAWRRHLHGTRHLFGRGPVGPAAIQAERISAVLRPRFEFTTTFGDMRRARERELIHFIEEQYLALDAMAENRAVLFTGPAGTGKTLLAVEAARRESAQGRSGRVVCFNSLLGNRLREMFAQSENVGAGTFHAYLLELSGLERAPENADQHFWSHDLLDMATERALELTDSERLDFIVIDEIQDVANDETLDLLDLVIKGGLQNGRILLFGDFDRQAIYEPGDHRDLLKQRIRGLPSYGLKVNCRNLPRIAHATETFNIAPGYQSLRRQDDGVKPTFLRFDRGTDQSVLLADAIRALKNEGFELHEIVVLSPRGAESTARRSEGEWLRQILVPASDGRRSPGRVAFTTIHAFKGLEAPAVVMTDLDRDSVPAFESLLYVGITRATDRLVMLIESRTMRAALGGPR